MSKLANLIEARQTGRVRVTPMSFMPITNIEEESLLSNYGTKHEYRLGLTMVVKGFAMPDSGDEIIRMKEMCKRQILHEVFGEFQPLIRRVERALYALDFDEARTALAELDNEMRW